LQNLTKRCVLQFIDYRQSLAEFMFILEFVVYVKMDSTMKFKFFNNIWDKTIKY